MSKYINFMEATPWIARHVRQVMVSMVTVVIAELAALLNHLPSLEYVGLWPTGIVPSDEPVSTPRPRITSCPRVLLDISHLGDMEPIIVFLLCAEVFKLFAEVKTLEIRDGHAMGRDRTPMDNSQIQEMVENAETLGENWKLEGAVLGWGTTPFLTTLLGVGALSHLNFLNCTILSSDLDPLGEVLRTIGSTLSSLHIKAVIGPQVLETNDTGTDSFPHTYYGQ